MNKATISADVISFTSLSDSQREYIVKEIRKLLSILMDKYADSGFYGRLIQGDYIECACNSPQNALRVALLLKTLVKSLNFKTGNSKSYKLHYLFEHGVRLAIAVAPLSKIDPDKGIIDGEAIYLSGRHIKKYSTYDKEKIIIKQSMFFLSHDQALQEEMETIFLLLDIVLSRCSIKQSEVLYFKLLGMSESQITKKLNRNQSTINQHSTAAGWLAVEKAVNYFEKVFS